MEQNYYPNNYTSEGANQYYPTPPCMRTASMNQCPFMALNAYRSPGRWTFGPFSIEYNIALNDISLVFKFGEKVIENATLTDLKPGFNFKFDLFGAASIQLFIGADFARKSLTISGTACVLGICNTFSNTLIATW